MQAFRRKHQHIPEGEGLLLCCAGEGLLLCGEGEGLLLGWLGEGLLLCGEGEGLQLGLCCEAMELAPATFCIARKRQSQRSSC